MFIGYKLDNKEININGKNLSLLASGKMGNVYKCKDSVLKVFSNDKNMPLDIETAEQLTNITTDRILLPKKLLFYNNNLRGYTLRRIDKRGSTKKITSLPKDELINNLFLIEKDVETLSNKNVLLNGISPDNVIFNGKLYLTDPSKYSILDIYPTEKLTTLNKFQIHLLLIELISSELKKENYTKYEISRLKDFLKEKDNEENSSDYFNKVIKNNGTIKQLIKKI